MNSSSKEEMLQPSQREAVLISGRKSTMLGTRALAQVTLVTLAALMSFTTAGPSESLE